MKITFFDEKGESFRKCGYRINGEYTCNAKEDWVSDKHFIPVMDEVCDALMREIKDDLIKAYKDWREKKYD